MSCLQLGAGFCGFVFLLAYVVYCWIAIYTASWMEDFTSWGDDLNVLTSFSDCSNTSTLDSLISGTTTFSVISWIFAIVSVYFVCAMCAVWCQVIKTCSSGKVIALNVLILYASLTAYVVEYFIILDLVTDVWDDTDACGVANKSTLEESETYYDNLHSFPTALTLFIYIFQVLSFCFIMWAGRKLGDAGGPQQAGYVQVGANRLSSLMQYGGLGAAGRPRTQSEHQRAVIVGAIAVTMYGFEFATVANCNDAMAKLHATQCGRQTALRDSIALGFNRMMELKDHLTRINAFDHNFIHIVLTDGEDTSSRISRERFLALQHVLDRAQFHRVCKTIFVGVGLEPRAEAELRAYSVLGGQHAEFRKCNEMDIESVFEHISINLIQRTRMAAIATDAGTVVLGAQERGIQFGFNHFLVLMTLDISGSMAGYRWDTVKRAVRSLLQNLKQSDIFGIVLFNDQTKVITGSKN